MRRLGIFFIGCFIANQARADYYEEFAKQYEKDNPDIVHPQKKALTYQEVHEAWQTAYSHFKPGYRPIIDENGVLRDWVPKNSPNN